ncbi:MAG: MerR family transcriptional regulator [Novosphingobium sp.]|nr:MerR family transcriptional regulator [Novosphingobium sp.]
MAGFKIGEFASAAGVSRDTIRYYERLGLLQASARNAAGYRIYEIDELERIQFIRSVQELGFSLEQTRELIEASSLGHARVTALLGVVRSKLDATKGNVSRLLQVERFLSDLSTQSAASGSHPSWIRQRQERSEEPGTQSLCG